MARIVIDPARSAGQPIVDEYDVLTITLADAAGAEGSIEGAAQLWDVPVGAVEVAVAFEQGRRFILASLNEENARFIAEQMGRIRRAQVETEQFVTEQRKLMAEAAKLDRDRPFTPGRYVAAGVAAAIAIMTAGAVFARYVLV